MAQEARNPVPDREHDNALSASFRMAPPQAAPPAPESVQVPAGTGFFARRHANKEIAEYNTAFETWKDERDAAAERLELAQEHTGETSFSGLVLKRGEALFTVLQGVGLIEDRRGPGQWTGGSSGVSIPIGSIGGRSIRYRTGSSRGQYTQGAMIPTAIDTGDLYITNQRVIFKGSKQTRECRFDKLVGFQHTGSGTIFSVSNRQKPTAIFYGPELAGWFDFRLDLALADYQGSRAQLVAQTEADLAAIDAAKPQPPTFG